MIWLPLTLITSGRSPNSFMVTRIPESAPSTKLTSMSPAVTGSDCFSASRRDSVVQFSSLLIFLSVNVLGMIGITSALNAVSQSFRILV